MKVIILPGLHGTDALHGDLVEALAQRDVEAIVVNYGNADIKYSDLVISVRELLPSTDFLLVAESFSGPVAIEIAAENPNGLKGVLFMATFAKSPRPLSSKFASITTFIPLRWKWSSVIAQPFLMGKWANSRFTELFHQVLSTLPSATIIGRLKQVLTVDKTILVREISVPYKYLAAQNDRLVPQRAAADFFCQAGQYCMVEGPHFLAQASPDKVAEVITEFIGELRKMTESLRFSASYS